MHLQTSEIFVFMNNGSPNMNCFISSKSVFKATFIIIFLIQVTTSFSQNRRSTNPFLVDYSDPDTVPGMSLIWNEEFNYTGIPNSSNWGYEYGFVRNEELQWYQPQNAYVSDGRLEIKGKNEKIVNPHFNENSGSWRTKREFAEYTSACIITKNLHEWNGSGYFEIRAKIDTSMGSWPAIWLLGTEGRWPDNGEIDIMEFYRIKKGPTILANVAWGSQTEYQPVWSSTKKSLSDFISHDPQWANKYHIWSMKWDSSEIQIFLDDELLNKTDLSQTINADGANPFANDNRFYLLLNLAIGANGGNPAHSKFPIKFEVDYVRIYQ